MNIITGLRDCFSFGSKKLEKRKVVVDIGRACIRITTHDGETAGVLICGEVDPTAHDGVGMHAVELVDTWLARYRNFIEVESRRATAEDGEEAVYVDRFVPLQAVKDIVVVYEKFEIEVELET